MIKINKKYLWFFVDIAFIHIALLLSIVIRFGNEFHHYYYLYKENILIISFIYIAFSLIFKLYDCFWRYTSIKEISLIGFTLLTTKNK
jgi:FlaA1/EpsC-like NDP-sugar epimerase